MYYPAKIINRRMLSPTVMMLDLEVPKLAKFLPGQWADFVAPPHEWIGGFSIASSPRDLPRVTLAVKKSSAPAATWVHEQSQMGKDVEVQVGGTFTLSDDNGDFDRPAIFCAGGIGISPILCQYREFLFQRSLTKTPTNSLPSIMFLYSVANQSELVFADELVELKTKYKETSNPSDKMIFALTRSEDWGGSQESYSSVSIELKTVRVLQPFLDESPADSVFYVCGPPSMIDDTVKYLREKRGISETSIRYEKWW